jgi:7,8-dihydropterin-6-yl-methyl-4-(beta-D-ribofuranosyl)aminobenzene 5'-phosphate synthase
MRITTLVENSVLPGRGDLTPEFGLSLAVEREHDLILFDTGATDVFVANAAALGVDLQAVGVAVLSHHHFDHGGGLAAFLGNNTTAPVYLVKSELRDRQFRAFGFVRRPIGLDAGAVAAAADRLRPVTGEVEIAPDVFLLTGIGGTFPRPRGNRRLFVSGPGGWEPDPFDHELVMVIRDRGGLVVFTGCSHNGVLNMVAAARERFPGEPVHAVLGGFHLIGIPVLPTMAASRAEVEAIGRQLLDWSVGRVLTGHCTGAKGYGVLAGVMGETLQPLVTGQVVEV